MTKKTKHTSARKTKKNPLLGHWSTPFGLPPFAEIKTQHYLPAIQRAFKDYKNSVRSIAKQTTKPTFANTVLPLELAHTDLDRVFSVFYNVNFTNGTPELMAIETKVMPIYAVLSASTYLNPKLLKRVHSIFNDRKKQKLDQEQVRLLERYLLNFERAGAGLKPTEKRRMEQLIGELAKLGTKFSQNVLADEQAYRLELTNPEDQEGLPEQFLASARELGASIGKPNVPVVTLSRSSVEPFLQFSTRRDLRKAAHLAWVKRGENGGATDNRELVKKTLQLRKELARLLGYKNYADFKLKDSMAQKTSAVADLFSQVWPASLRKVASEKKLLEEVAVKYGVSLPLEPWDWRYLAEKVRKEKYSFDESSIKPFLNLEQMLLAMFAVAERLFGLKFMERFDLPKYDPTVRTWEVTTRSGTHVAIFLGDYFARTGKRSGAWMSQFRTQNKIQKSSSPLIINVMNLPPPPASGASLLSVDDVRTLFHEFGHGLHGILSNVTYPTLAGTNVVTDFVELPSQLMEHWISHPKLLQEFATHFNTKKTIPLTLIKQLDRARTFNEGFALVEFLACAMIDLELHCYAEVETIDLESFESEFLSRHKMPREIFQRHRIPHFSHLFSGDGYAAGYYSYLWSQVMDADAFEAFEEQDDIFHRQTADKLKEFIYSAGNSRDPGEAYRKFRGRDPQIQALLRKKGLLDRDT